MRIGCFFGGRGEPRPRALGQQLFPDGGATRAVDKAVDKRPLQWISRRFRNELPRMNVSVAAERISIACCAHGAQYLSRRWRPRKCALGVQRRLTRPSASSAPWIVSKHPGCLIQHRVGSHPTMAIIVASRPASQPVVKVERLIAGMPSGTVHCGPWRWANGRARKPRGRWRPPICRSRRATRFTRG